MKPLSLITLFALIVCLSSCKKSTCDAVESNTVASASEIATIQSYLSANSLTATQHSSGFFYNITDMGSGDTPDLCSSIAIQYKGTLLNGTVFDQSTSNVSFILKDLIIGWQKGLQLIHKGGKIILYIPPSLAYGSSAVGSVPANSTLIFTVDLNGVVK